MMCCQKIRPDFCQNLKFSPPDQKSEYQCTIMTWGTVFTNGCCSRLVGPITKVWEAVYCNSGSCIRDAERARWSMLLDINVVWRCVTKKVRLDFSSVSNGANYLWIASTHQLAGKSQEPRIWLRTKHSPRSMLDVLFIFIYPFTIIFQVSNLMVMPAMEKWCLYKPCLGFIHGQCQLYHSHLGFPTYVERGAPLCLALKKSTSTTQTKLAS